MAGKKRDIEETAEEVPAVEETNGGTGIPPDSDYCILVNTSRGPLSCPLRTGRTVPLGPRVAGLNIHRSEPVLKKDRAEILFTWERLGKLAFEAVKGGVGE